jgi:hypothetical protein
MGLQYLPLIRLDLLFLDAASAALDTASEHVLTYEPNGSFTAFKQTSTGLFWTRCTPFSAVNNTAV